MIITNDFITELVGEANEGEKINRFLVSSHWLIIVLAAVTGPKSYVKCCHWIEIWRKLIYQVQHGLSFSAVNQWPRTSRKQIQWSRRWTTRGIDRGKALLPLHILCNSCGTITSVAFSSKTRRCANSIWVTTVSAKVVAKFSVHLSVRSTATVKHQSPLFFFFAPGGNESLESIDLSWNNIRGRSAIDIAHGIKVETKN